MNITIKIERDIEKAKAKLIAKAKKTGIYENFGQKEVLELRHKYFDYIYTNLFKPIDSFDNWCMNLNDNSLKTYAIN